MSGVTADVLALCGFANSVSTYGSISSTPQLQLASYEKDNEDGLALHYKADNLELGAFYNDQEYLAGSSDTVFGVAAPSSVADLHLGQLNLDINLCRATARRFACAAGTPTDIKITVANSIFQADGETDQEPGRHRIEWPVTTDPIPTTLAADNNAKAIIYRWQSADPTERVHFSAQARTLLSGLRAETVTIGGRESILVTVYWGQAISFALALLALVVAHTVNVKATSIRNRDELLDRGREQGQRQAGDAVAVEPPDAETKAATDSRHLQLHGQIQAGPRHRDHGGVLGGLALVALSMTVDFESSNSSIERLGQLWLATLWGVATWSSAASRRTALLSASGAGFFAVLCGVTLDRFDSGLALDAAEILRAAGISAAGVAVGLSLISRLRQGLKLLPLRARRPNRRAVSAWPPYGIVDLRTMLRLIAAVGLAAGSAVLVGYSMGRSSGHFLHSGRALTFRESGVSVDAEVIGLNLLNVLTGLASLFVLAYIADALYRPGIEFGTEPTPPGKLRSLLTLLLAVVVTPAAPAWAGFTLPVWLVTWPLLYAAVKPSIAWSRDEFSRTTSSCIRKPGVVPRAEQLVMALQAERSYAELIKADQEVSSGTRKLEQLEGKRQRRLLQYPTDQVKEFFARGPRIGWQRNGQWSAYLGCVLAVLPIGYYAWEAAQTVPSRLTYNGGLYVVAGLLIQVARWVSLGFVFGALYAWLPTRIGITKAAVLAGAWSAGALAIELLARWLGVNRGGVWLFNSLQVFLFLVVLAVFFDVATVRRAGGSVRRLSELYRVTTIRARLAFAGPLLGAVVALIAEVQAGAGTSTVQLFVDALVKGIPSAP